MLIVTIRTDKPEAELGMYDGTKQLAYFRWEAHRELAETIHQQLNSLITGQHRELSSVVGLVVFRGPGSFTGLRIGISVANALAYGLNIPIVGTMTDKWIAHGIDRLMAGESDSIVVPEYGSLPHITPQKK